METAISISLMILALYVACWPGNILSFIRVFVANQLDRLIGVTASVWIQKPIWGCLPCMASIWTTVFLWDFTIYGILMVSGILVLFDHFITHPDDEQPTDD